MGIQTTSTGKNAKFPNWELKMNLLGFLEISNIIPKLTLLGKMRLFPMSIMLGIIISQVWLFEIFPLLGFGHSQLWGFMTFPSLGIYDFPIVGFWTVSQVWGFMTFPLLGINTHILGIYNFPNVAY